MQSTLLKYTAHGKLFLLIVNVISNRNRIWFSYLTDLKYRQDKIRKSYTLSQIIGKNYANSNNILKIYLSSTASRKF